MLHGNASSQLEGTSSVFLLCPYGISVLCIDTTGCGRSDGDFIGLGFLERADVAASISYLREVRKVGPIAIWGRSMGATTAVWCAADRMDVQAVICDSTFASVRWIAEDLLGQHWAMRALGKVAFWVIDRCVKHVAGFWASEIEIGPVERAVCPALFVHATTDSLVGVRQSRAVFARYGASEKFMVTPDGDHNSHRPADVLAIELKFLLDTFGIEAEVEVEGPVDYGGEHFGGLSDMLKRWK
jgi:pimeloyl-ACP methyl ester carboxylesterase